jgi:hypothetical protein
MVGYLAITLLLLVAGSQLVRPSHVVLWSAVVLVAAVLEAVLRSTLMPYGLAMIAWIAVIIAVTEGRPSERALLLRVSVTVIYLFASSSSSRCSARDCTSASSPRSQAPTRV